LVRRAGPRPTKDGVARQEVQQCDLLGVAKAIDDFGAVSLKLEEAFKKNDASAIAALFTEDGILVAADSMFSGRQAIQKIYADSFQRWPMTTFSGQRYQLNAIDNAVWSVGRVVEYHSKRDGSQIRRRLLVSDLYSRGGRLEDPFVDRQRASPTESGLSARRVWLPS
jgi:uncharacterized protein (TIGR02246 family)